jgi:hypothetical protein
MLIVPTVCEGSLFWALAVLKYPVKDLLTVLPTGITMRTDSGETVLTRDTIRKKYYQLALFYHPDKKVDVSGISMKHLNQAWSTVQRYFDNTSSVDTSKFAKNAIILFQLERDDPEEAQRMKQRLDEEERHHRAEAEELRRRAEAEELRRRAEAEEFLRRAEELRRRAEAEELRRRAEAEERTRHMHSSSGGNIYGFRDMKPSFGDFVFSIYEKNVKRPPHVPFSGKGRTFSSTSSSAPTETEQERQERQRKMRENCAKRFSQ